MESEENVKVLAFKPNPRKPDQGFVRLTEMIDVQTVDGHKEQVEGEIIEAWTPEVAKVAELVGKELPDGWTLRDGPKGKQLLPPKARGEGPRAAWANTEEGQKYVQERMDRRTALMTAGEQWGQDHGAMGTGNVLSWAEDFYGWLRESVSGGPPPKASTSAAGVSPPQGDAQGPPSDTSNVSPGVGQSRETVSPTARSSAPPRDTSSDEEAHPSSEDRREGDAGDNTVEADTPGSPGAVTPQTVQTPGSPSRRQRCLHTEGIKTITKETGGSVDVCEKCGVVVST
jgi:hypothetical protein